LFSAYLPFLNFCDHDFISSPCFEYTYNITDSLDLSSNLGKKKAS
jgi:hypothetical protein